MKHLIDGKNLVWLASYPRSGNTYLRTILWHCFGLRSASIYPGDLAFNRRLEEYVGHIELQRDIESRSLFLEADIQLLKTHEQADDDRPAIYVIRDGRAAAVSLWKFYKGNLPLQSIVEGTNQFGNWAAHVKSWSPWERQNTLLLEYQDMVENLPKVLKDISRFLQRDILSANIPARDAIAGVDGRWVKKKSSWKADLSGDLLKRFNLLNKDMLKKAGYL